MSKKKEKKKGYNKSPVPFEVKKEVKRRQGYKCACCGKRYQYFVLEVHHIVPRSKGGSNDMANLVAVDSNCHKIIHHYRRKGMEVPLSYGETMVHQ